MGDKRDKEWEGREKILQVIYKYEFRKDLESHTEREGTQVLECWESE